MPGDLYSTFRRLCVEGGGKCLIYEAGPERTDRYTYGQILGKVETLRRSLAALSIPPRSRIALLSENRHEWIVAFFACVSLGLTVVPVDPQLTVPEWMKVLGHAEAKLLFLSDRFWQYRDVLASAPHLREVVLLGQTLEGAAHEPEAPVDHSEIASIVYTSGTTGQPKGVMLTHANLISIAGVMDPGAPSPSAVNAAILPLNHVYGFNVFLGSLLQGEAVILYPTVKQEILFRSFREVRPYTLVSVPALFDRLGRSVLSRLAAALPPLLYRKLQRAMDGTWGEDGRFLRRIKKTLFRRVHREFGGRLKHVGCGGAPLDPRTARLFQSLGVPIYEGYGLTETSPLITLSTIKAHRFGSVGRVVEGVQVKLGPADESGEGEIWVRGLGLMKGYYRDDEATSRAIDAEGWFHTGDLGRFDDDGFLFLSGRLKDVIVTPNGKNVHPEEIECLFRNVPLAEEVCAFGVPSRGGHGEIVHVQVVPSSEAVRRLGWEETCAAIKEDIRRRGDGLAEYKRPRSVGFSEVPFPKNTALKVKKYEVKNEWRRQMTSEGTIPAGLEGDPALEMPVGRMVASLLKALLPADAEIRSESSLELDLGMDSLVRIEFWAAIEKRLRREIPETEIPRLKTAGEVIAYVTSVARGEVETTDSETSIDWSEILDAHADENATAASRVLESHPHARRALLKAVRLVFGRFSRLSARGLENLPRTGAFILAPNHESHLDSFFVASLLPSKIQRNMVVIGKQEHFASPVSRFLARLGHVVPVNRENVSVSTLAVGAQVLKQGHVLLVHPEGTRSSDGRLLPFKNGVAILANHLRCPVVPVYIEGAHEFWPKDSARPRSWSRITVTFGRPLPPVAADEDAFEGAAHLTRRLQEEVASMAQG
jgi:long-chain acyl-CoA synthetase